MGNTTVLQNLTETPEGAILFRRNIGLGGGAPCEPLHLVQYDDKLPILAATLWIGSERYIPPAGSQIRIRWKKPDGYVAYNPALGMDEDGVVYVQITKEMTAANGAAFANIEITNGGGVKNSDSIPVRVSSNAVLEGDIESEDQWLTMDEILALVQSLSQQTETNAATAATDAQRAEVAREATETAAETVKQIVAGNEALPIQASFDTFAQALKTDTGKGTSHEIYPDPSSNISVTAYGYTEQEGEGDPSPENVRPIMVGGDEMYKIVLTGSESGWNEATDPDGGYKRFRLSIVPKIANGGVCNYYKPTTMGNKLPTDKTVYLTYTNTLVFRDDDFAGIEEFKIHLANLNENGNPLTVWAFPHNTSTAQTDGIYIPNVLSNDVYNLRKFGCKGTALPIKEKLCNGDHVVSQQDGQCVEYHSCKFIVLTGNEEETAGGSSESASLRLGFNTKREAGKEFCSIAKNIVDFTGNGYYTTGSVIIFGSGFVTSNFGSKSNFIAHLKEQYAAGTPVVASVVLETPVTYTHAPVPLIARPDSTGKVTVSGEKQVSAVYNKSIKKAFEELQTAILNLGGAT